jgi:ABC-type spermidine/putrescine transport system permease subunit I
MQALRNTAEISVWVTVLSLVLGYPLAYLMTVVPGRVRTLLIVLVLVPFWTSILVRTFAWMVILGKRGIINQLLIGWGVVDKPVALIYNMLGVQIGMVHVLLPFMVFPLLNVMTRIDASLVTAARSLGASPRQAFLRIFLPLSLPGVSAGCVLVFLLAVGFYITPALLGGEGQVTFTTLIELVVRDLLDWNFGASLGVFLLTVVGTLFVLFSTLLGLERLTGDSRA